MNIDKLLDNFWADTADDGYPRQELTELFENYQKLLVECRPLLERMAAVYYEEFSDENERAAVNALLKQLECIEKDRSMANDQAKPVDQLKRSTKGFKAKLVR